MDLLLIPVHLQKMNWAISLVTGLKAAGGLPQGVTLGFVVSNEIELMKLSELLVSFGLEDGIALVDAAAYSRTVFPSGEVTRALEKNANKGIVNLKKFLGLHWARARGYHFAIVMDTDVYFSQSADIAALFEITKSNYSKKVIHGAGISGASNADMFRTINGSALEIFDEADAALLAKDGVSDIYTWFMEPPSYALADVGSFFDYMGDVHGSLEAFFLRLGWHHFEHILFTFFRVLRLGAVVRNYNDTGIHGVPEQLSVVELDAIRTATGFVPVWMSFFSGLVSASAARVLFPGIGIFFHFDRIGR